MAPTATTDLLVPAWDDTGIAGLGTTKWLWHANNGSAFASSASNRTLPAGYPDDTFDKL
jgi:hypothetical protein